MSLDDRFLAEALRQGHVLAMDEDGEVDWFALEYEHHNGPMCVKCDEMWCHHCERPGNIKACKG